MNKRIAVMTVILAISMMASAAAASAAGQAGGKGTKQTAQQEVQVDVTTETEATVTEADEPTTEGEAAAEETEAADEQAGTGNGKGKGKNGAKGLQNAHENVKGKPSEARIAELLLTKYGIDVTEEEAADPNVLTDTLEAEGNIDAAVEVQEEIVLADPTEIEGYKKLGKLKAKQNKGAKKGIVTYVDGEEQQFEEQPFMTKGRALVPFRAIAASLKADVNYDASTKVVTVTRGDVEVQLTLGSTTALVNGVEVKLDVVAVTKNGRVFVPMRFLSEALNADVVWEPESESVIIIDGAAPAEEEAAAGETGTADGTEAGTEAPAEAPTTDAPATEPVVDAGTDAPASTEPAAETTN